jgi:3',5'-cyclic AMP phosphodiesterase CpdA
MSEGTGAGTTRLLHLSDVHFGRPHVPAHVAAAEAFAENGAFDAIIVSGDMSQRARRREFQRARALLDRLTKFAPVLVVPGNHDAAWWFAPLGFGPTRMIHSGYRRWINQNLEPTLQVPGATVVGLNSSPGIRLHTLTKRPRDLSVKGALTSAQLADARARFAAAPAHDLRVLVVHHNVVPGDLSRRWGLTKHETMLDEIVATGADIVLSGHDHQERVETVLRPKGQFVASTAGTLSDRSRGARPSAFMTVLADAERIIVTPHVYDVTDNIFHPTKPHISPRLAR